MVGGNHATLMSQLSCLAIKSSRGSAQTVAGRDNAVDAVGTSSRAISLLQNGAKLGGPKLMEEMHVQDIARLVRIRRSLLVCGSVLRVMGIKTKLCSHIGLGGNKRKLRGR